MPETRWIIESLKHALKEQGVTYNALAKKLRLSESTIKRWFSKQNLDLKQLERICVGLNMTLFDIINRAKHLSESEIYFLTLEQEKALVCDMKFFGFFWMLVNRNKLETITKRFKLSLQQVQKYLLKLDALKILELREKNRFTLKVPRNVHWTENGPLEKIARAKFLPQFIKQKFNREDDCRKFIVVKLKPESIFRFKKRFDELTEQIFKQSFETDAAQENSKSTGLLLAFGRMDFSLHEAIQNKTSLSPRGRGLGRGSDKTRH